MKTKQRYNIIIISIFCASILFGATTYNINDSDEKRLSAVSQTDDPALLAEIAQNDPASFIRRVAVGKITDQQLLAKIEQNDEDKKVRVTARAQLSKVSAEVSAQKARQDVFEAPSKEIILLPPLVRYLCIKSDTLLNIDETFVRDIQKAVYEKSIELLKQNGFELQKSDSHMIETNSAYNTLASNITKLFYSRLSSDTAEYLEELGTISSNVSLLAVELKVKIGSEGSWNPTSGATTFGNSYSVVRAALLSPLDSQQLWNNSSLFREIPNLEKSDMDEAIRELFTNLTVGKEL